MKFFQKILPHKRGGGFEIKNEAAGNQTADIAGKDRIYQLIVEIAQKRITSDMKPILLEKAAECENDLAGIGLSRRQSHP